MTGTPSIGWFMLSESDRSAALRSWRMANRLVGGDDPPTEVQLQELWRWMLTREDGGDGRTSAVGLFEGLPQPPEGWRNKTGHLDFALRPAEADYLRTR